MIAFVSSTCYDLLDLRTELHEDLRDLGIEARFSEIKESGFEVPADSATNSIENCLVNLRASSVVIVVLSQRYGTPLPEAFGKISATHVEIREAQKLGKPIFFYIRDRLIADWSTWKRNGRKADYVPAWAAPKDAPALFALIEEHQALVNGDGEANRNNWFWPFQTSHDLRADIRRRLNADAFRATGERMVKLGQAPIIMVSGQSIGPIYTGTSVTHIRMDFSLINAGNVAALAVSGSADFGNGNLFSASGSMIPVIRPEDGPGGREIGFNIPLKYLHDAHKQTKPTDAYFACDIAIRYKLATGHVMEDRTRVVLDMFLPTPQFHTSQIYLGKKIVGMESFVLG